MIGNHYELIVIPIGVAIAANIDADKEDSGKTSKTFTVGLSPTGKEPATHQWCCWWMSDEKAVRLKKDFLGTADNPGAKYGSRVFDSREWTPDQILTKMNLKRIEVEMLTKKI